MLMWQISIGLVNVAIVLAALIGYRYIVSWFVGVHVKNELDKKDNFSFGVTVAAGVLALMLMLSAAISGYASASILQEFINVTLYSIYGVIFLIIGNAIQDRLILRGIDLDQAIKSENLAAGFVVAANLLAVGLMINGIYRWIEETPLGMPPHLSLLVIFLASQVVLAFVALIRTKVYSSRHNGKSWSDAIHSGNKAVAIRYFGQIIATALAIGAAGNLVQYDSATMSGLLLTAGLWLSVSLGITLAVWILYKAIVFIVLTKVNIVEEVDNQQNVGVAAIEAALFIGIAALILGFLA
ncbi:DUF350 domain-containing protein [Marinicella sp. W31]|uniref:DUF350 domain-containing protein n=1 Tax=Marinicella sp. W31 TaxID=3023713 RepID=UPI00375803D6